MWFLQGCSSTKQQQLALDIKEMFSFWDISRSIACESFKITKMLTFVKELIMSVRQVTESDFEKKSGPLNGQI
jgi:hypothetical protein